MNGPAVRLFTSDFILDNTLPPGLSFAPPSHFENIQADVAQATGPEELDQAHSQNALEAQSNDQETAHLHHQNHLFPNSPKQPPALGPTTLASPKLKPFAPTISRAPVRYDFPPPPAEIPNSEAELETVLEAAAIEAGESVDNEVPRSLRPGQRGFAERLMSKYGWTKGSGLGASGTGIINPLRVQMEKQKKKPDSEGGGFVGPGGRGKILGGKKSAARESAEVGKFGTMSEVIVLYGMVDGMDLNAEMDQAGDGGLMQEIGDECSNKVSASAEPKISHHILLMSL